MLQMQADRNLDAGDAVMTVDQLLNQFTQRQRDAMKTYEAWRVKQQLRSHTSAHLDQLKRHAAEVIILTILYYSKQGFIQDFFD